MSFKAILTFILMSLLSSAVFAGSAVGSLFTYEGVLTDSSGNPITTSASVTFQVLYSSCVLYSETQSVTPGSSGEFSVIVGAGNRTDTTSNTADSIFASSGSVGCNDGSTATVTSATGRSLHIAVNGTDLTPDVTITNVPTAIYAAKASKLGDNVASDFLLKAGLPTCATGNYLTYDGSSLTCSAVSGATGGTVTSVTATAPLIVATGSTTPALSLPQASSGVSGFLSGSDWSSFNSKMSSSLTMGQIFVGNSTNVATAVSVSGDANLSSTGALTLASVGTAGTYYKVTADAKGRVTSGSTALTVTDIPSLDWSKIATGKPTTLSGYGITDSLITNGGGTPSITTGTDSAKPTSPTTGAIFFATDTKNIYQYNAGTWTTMGSGVSAGTGTVTSVSSANSYLSVATGTTTPVVTANVGTAANTLAAGNDSRIVNAVQTGSAATLTSATLNSVILKDSGSNTVTLQAPTSISTSYVLKFPTGTATSGQVLTSDGAGNLSWSTPSTTATGYSGILPVANGGTGSSTALSGNKVMISNGNTIVEGPALTNGQLLIGSTGNAPVAGTLTSSTGISISQSAGSITLGVNGVPSSALALADGKMLVGQSSGTAAAVSASGDLTMTDTGAFTVARLAGTTLNATAPTTGQVLRYNGTAWTPNFVSMFDLRSTTTGSQAFGGVGCTAGQTLTWISGTDNLSCTPIAVNDGQVTNMVSRPTNTFLAAPNGSAGPATYRTIASADLPMTVYQNGGNAFGAAATLGTNDSNGLSFLTNATAAMTITNTQKIGIGTSTPVTKLSIVDTTSPYPMSVSSASTLFSGIKLENTSSGSNDWFVAARPASGFGIYDQNYGTATPRFSIDAMGNTVFSTKDTTTKVALIKDSASGTQPYNPGYQMITYGGNYNDWGILEFGSYRGNSSSVLATQSGDTLGAVQAYGSDSIAGTVPTAQIRFIAESAFTPSSHPGAILFSTAAATAYSERMRITSTGNVGIGTSAPTALLHVNGAAIATTWNTSSDVRLKENIKAIDDPLAKILAIRGVEFDWRKDVEAPTKHDETHDIGVIAQEIEKVFPEAVTTPTTGYKSVAYSKLVAPLIEGVKALYARLIHVEDTQTQQSREIASLKEENAAMKKQLENQRKEIDEIKKTLKNSSH